MFKYTKEVIINSPKNGEGTTMFPDAGDGRIRVYRAGDYDPAKIVDKKIYKTVGKPAVVATLKLECKDLIKSNDVDGVKSYEIGLYQLSINVKMDGKFLGEFAYPNYAAFRKPVMVGFEVDAALAADGEKLATKLEELFNMAIPYNNQFVKVTRDGSALNFVASDPYMFFPKEEVLLERYDPTMCDSCLGEYMVRDIEANVTNTTNVKPFATGEWLIENLRFPTYPNFRYYAAGKDEYPIPGVVYTQYSFAYDSPRPGYGGLMGVGQKVEAVTRHIFYVAEGAVADFEKAFEACTITEDAMVEY